jgi:hypothetical protein
MSTANASLIETTATMEMEAAKNVLLFVGLLMFCGALWELVSLFPTLWWIQLAPSPTTQTVLYVAKSMMDIWTSQKLLSFLSGTSFQVSHLFRLSHHLNDWLIIAAYVPTKACLTTCI